ncbi:NAD(P)H-binding protein [Arthrobacter sp. NPDC058288]|uniref:NAD(P)H-binding protein n=1 Tax=Arthrobacter sp. NPDC058288 TaxID=3346424 RepID=UPI0036ED299A
MSHRPHTVLIVGATGSVGRCAVAEALQQGYAVRALVRDRTRAARMLPDGVDLFIGDLTRPGTLGPATDGVDAIVFTHGTTRPGVAYAQWKLRGERLVRASGNPYTIVRPGWFDYNQPGQRKIVMLQGDRRRAG